MLCLITEVATDKHAQWPGNSLDHDTQQIPVSILPALSQHSPTGISCDSIHQSPPAALHSVHVHHPQPPTEDIWPGQISAAPQMNSIETCNQEFKAMAARAEPIIFIETTPATFSKTRVEASLRVSDIGVSHADSEQRRRAQNRAAQRAYRQRKDDALRQQQDEVRALRTRLDRARHFNKALCNAVASLRRRLDGLDPPYASQREEGHDYSGSVHYPEERERSCTGTMSSGLNQAQTKLR